ncbi:ABC transporter ATP-binding protein [Pseudodesulfovibrio thermohalotolerans]|uniref:ABC transporter ATP-binding protein n=1 Tax=Pseudodesulfovibrio thermohalotolerans TaxID=2880651 RepID=UPI0024424209|nr:ABC transporter ATP-binding protein [Pseudodesulfovibrio thermohalotolerans]WFS61612.1 ABC transporter ATP-binding protein [Pseudodesulfovibrio thermohalotolerans]
MTAKTAIELRDISKAYGPEGNQEYALRNATLNVVQGEVLMLMGPSGSGKTTLLSIMGCILKPTSGSLSVAGRDISGLSQQDLSKIRLDNIGYIFQEYNLFPTLNVLENVMVALDLRGYSRSQAREMAMATLTDVGLDDKAAVKPATMSGGQKQRLAIARALAGSPKVILADEPTAALDSVNGQQVMDLMHSLAKRGDRAVVVVTHDPRTVDFADRIVTIEDGRLYPQPHNGAKAPERKS